MKALMVQGTSSSAGKSLITSALCRYFSGMGIKTAPFKAQNMSLNSYVVDGGEMAWAQVTQSWAAGTEPSLDFNPILLKPTGEAGSQVIAEGKAVKVMPAQEYHFDFNETARGFIDRSLQRLSRRYDLLIMEGAGSSAEINLLPWDLANWYAAERADAEIVLVADIERGGSFASVYGSLMLLPEENRKRVKGWVINKFRGDKEVLTPAIKEIEELIGIPMLGVIPYLSDLDLPPEDSLELEDRGHGQPLRVGIVRLPSIANFTDFQPISRWAEVKYLLDPGEAGQLDLLIIPGSKRTVDDMIWLDQRGWSSHARKIAASTPILGICGGYQMLGEALHDPGTDKSATGIGLLPISTVFAPEKDLFQVKASARFPWMGFEGNGLSGYEIHCGQVEGHGKPSWMEFLRHPGGKKTEDGMVSGMTAGTHLHGLFHNEEFCLHIANALRQAKGLPPLDSLVPMEELYRNSLDRLSALVSQHMDMKALERIIGES